MNWRKSSHSGPNSGQCVEVARWRKSSHSGPNGGECVEVAHTVEVTGVRDSKNPEGPVLRFGETAWTRFLVRGAGGELR